MLTFINFLIFSLLSATHVFAANDFLDLSKKVEVARGSAKGVKYSATIKNIKLQNFDVSPQNLSVGAEPDGAIGLSFYLPNAQVTAVLTIRAKPKRGGLSLGIFEEMSQIKRQYEIRLSGVRGKLSLRLGANAGHFALLDFGLSRLDFDHTKVHLTKDSDGPFASILNDFTLGSLDHWIKNMLRKQLTGRSLAPQVTSFIRSAIESKLAGFGKVSLVKYDENTGIELKVEPHSAITIAESASRPALIIPIRIQADAREGAPVALHTENVTAVMRAGIETEVDTLQGSIVIGDQRFPLNDRPDLTLLLSMVAKQLVAEAQSKQLEFCLSLLTKAKP